MNSFASGIVTTHHTRWAPVRSAREEVIVTTPLTTRAPAAARLDSTTTATMAVMAVAMEATEALLVLASRELRVQRTANAPVVHASMANAATTAALGETGAVTVMALGNCRSGLRTKAL